jgi:hypothetical protein
MSRDRFESLLDDLSDLLLKLGDVIETDRLVLCGNFNCPGSTSMSILTDLSSLLDAHGLQQFAMTSTRRTLNGKNISGYRRRCINTDAIGWCAIESRCV